jgi:hypothetical protein
VHFTCASDPQGQDNPPVDLQVRQLDINSNQGFMVVTAHDPSSHAAISSNVLFADWTVIDYTKLTAYGAEAITFQGVSALANDGDTNYSFDGKEYSTFPAQLASNFYAPTSFTPTNTDQVTGELILLTLDVTFNTSFQNPVEVNGFVYDNKEIAYNYQYDFNCFVVAPLQAISLSFVRDSLLSDVGHFDMDPRIADAGDPGHETQFGTGGNSRIRPVVGWIVQSIQTGGQIPSPVGSPGIGAGPPFGAGTGSWARTLGTSTVAFTPLAGDTPTLSTP